jgi:RNA polymerase sigma-70 factor (ECF subfamily)
MNVEQRDSDLVAAAVAGDQEALVVLLERHRDAVYRFGMRMCASPADAEDVVQDTLLTAARKLETFRGEAAFSSWLYAIARSACAKHRRADARVDQWDGSEPADSAPHPEEALARQRLHAILERAVTSLEPAYREVLLLRDAEGLTAPETAAALELSVAAVKSRLHRARQMLRDRIEGLVRTQPGAMPPPRCPDVVGWMAERMQQELGPQACAELEIRLAKCGDPAGEFDSLRRLLGACRQSAGPEVPEKLKESIRLALCKAAEREKSLNPSSDLAALTGEGQSKGPSGG